MSEPLTWSEREDLWRRSRGAEWIIHKHEVQRLLTDLERVEDSMVRHFQEEHLAGDGPEIDRWKARAKQAEAERDRFEQLAHVRLNRKDSLRAVIQTRNNHIKHLEKRVERADAELESAKERIADLECITGLLDALKEPCRHVAELERLEAELKARDAEGSWVCSACGHTEYREREALCWKCGHGEMQYRPSDKPIYSLLRDELRQTQADLQLEKQQHAITKSKLETQIRAFSQALSLLHKNGIKF
jgi:rubrerythrin